MSKSFARDIRPLLQLTALRRNRRDTPLQVAAVGHGHPSRGRASKMPDASRAKLFSGSRTAREAGAKFLNQLQPRP